MTQRFTHPTSRILCLLTLLFTMSTTTAWADTNVGTAAELRSAIEGLTDDNQTINLTAKVTLVENINATHSFTLNLGDYSITKGDYSISLNDGVTVTTSKVGAYFSTTHNGWEICRQKISTGGYKYLPAAPVAKQSTSLYYASLEDAIDDYSYAIYLQSNATMTRDVTRSSTGKTYTLTISLGDYTITNGSYKIYLHKDVQAKLDKQIDSSIFALCSGESGSLYTYESSGTNKYCYVFGNEKEAKIGETEYESFTAAVDNAQENDVITLLRHVALANYTMTSPTQTFKVKKDGYSITIVGYEEYVAKSSTADGITTYTQAPAAFKITKADNTVSYSTDLSLLQATGTTVTLLKNFTTTSSPNCGSTAYINKSIILDLGGKTLYVNTSSNNSCIRILYGCGLTIKNGTIEMTPTASDKSNGIYVDNACSLIIEPTATIKAHGVSAVTVWGTATLETEGTLYAENDFVIAGNGGNGNGGYSVNIAGGSVTSDGQPAIYHPNTGTVTISDGEIIGATAIYQKCGTLNITGGTITGNGTKTDFVHNGNGANATGDAVVIENCGYPGGTPVPSITGGTFNSTNAKAVASYAYGEYKPVTGIISGGTYSSNVNDLVAEGKMAVQENNTYKVYAVETNTTVNTAEVLQQTMTVKDGNDTKQTITISVTPTSEQSETAEGEVALEQVDMTSVIGNIIETADFGTAEQVSVTVELQVNAGVTSYDLDGDTKTITFEVKPEAVVTINNQAAASVELSNDNLAPNATFTFTLNVTAMGLNAGDQVKVVHRSIDPNYKDETFMATVWAKDDNRYVTITTTHFSEFEITNEAISANDDITLIDGVTEYNITTDDVTVKSATYERTFPETQVNKFMGWFVPFDYTVTVDDAARAKFYKIDMIAHSATQGTTDQIDESKIWIHLKEVTAGTTLKGNKPYLIKPLISGKFTFEGNNKLLAMTNESILSASTTSNEYNFYGTYSVFTKAEESDADFMYMKGGQIHWCTITGITVPAFRWIIKVNGKADYARIAFIEDGEETTAIQNTEVAESRAIEGYYTLNGVKVEKPGKGVYVVKYANGQVSKIRIR